MLTVRMLAISLELFGGRSSSRTYRLRLYNYVFVPIQSSSETTAQAN